MQTMIPNNQSEDFVIITHITCESSKENAFYIAAIEIFLQLKPNIDIPLATTTSSDFDFEKPLTGNKGFFDIGNIDVTIKKHKQDPNNTWLYSYQTHYTKPKGNEGIIKLCIEDKFSQKLFPNLSPPLIQKITQKFISIQADFENYCNNSLELISNYYEIGYIHGVITEGNRLEKIFTLATAEHDIEPLNKFLTSFFEIKKTFAIPEQQQKMSTCMATLCFNLTLEQILKSIKDCQTPLQLYLEKITLKIKESKNKLLDQYSDKIQIILDTLNSGINLENIDTDLSIEILDKNKFYLAHIRLEKFMSVMVKNGLINDEYFILITQQLNQKVDVQLERLQFWQETIEATLDLKLLNSINLRKILNCETIDRSCQARLQGGIGLGIFNTEAKQKRWGYFFQGMQQIVKENLTKLSLFDLLDSVANRRGAIAQKEFPKYNKPIFDKEEYFGMWQFKRILHDAGDYYGIDKSVASPAITQSIIDVVKENLSKYNLCLTGTSPNTFQFNLQIPLNDSIISLGTKQIIVHFSMDTINPSQSKITAIQTKFFWQDETTVKNIIQNLDHDLLTTIKQAATLFPQLPPSQIPAELKERTLFTLGVLVYALLSLYLFVRGSSAINKAFTLELIHEIYSHSLEDINMGKNHDIPFDIYAQIIEDPFQFARDLVSAVKFAVAKKEAETTASYSNNPTYS